jgi:putative redox protein
MAFAESRLSSAVRPFAAVSYEKARSKMVELTVTYSGGLRCDAVHGPSGTKLTTDAPVDNHGRGESYSPTDLMATALGSCMLTLMGIRGGAHESALQGATAVVHKHMTTTAPRRIARLEVTLRVPGGAAVPLDERERLEKAAHTCPVRLSLLDAIDVPVVFEWQ